LDCFYKIYLIVSKYCNMTQMKYYISLVEVYRRFRGDYLSCTLEYLGTSGVEPSGATGGHYLLIKM
jgi:hypothetical protein